MLGALGESAESTLVAFGHQVGKIGEAKKLLQVFISGRNSKELSALPIEVEAELKTAAAVR